MAHKITDKCNGCGLCAKLCPVAAISGEIKSIHTINIKRCVDCGVCGRACTRGAVLDSEGQVVARVPRKEWAKPVIDTSLCSACQICVYECGKNALAISLPKEPGDLAVYAYLQDARACVGCGICARECPLQAISMEVVS